MKFHFEFDIKKLSPPITHKHKIMLVGSCFTENMGQKLEHYKFSQVQNPGGIMFNPVSVAESMIRYIDNEQAAEKDLFYFNEAWHSWKHHSKFSAPTVEAVLENINHSTTRAHHYLRVADYLMITLGSAWTYTLTEKAVNGNPGSVAANNHKAPADWFFRKLLSPEEILSTLDPMIHRLFNFNPKLTILFTISPVRHLREGVVENNRSKAALILAVHRVVDKFENLYYFPAYEIVIDDLRDYRFYAEDLVHPNYSATQYVWEKFTEACFDEQTRKLLEEIHLLKLAYQHKPFNAASEAHRKFKQRYLEKTNELKSLYPYLDLARELEYFGS
jgi:hypothetical protein